jgi:chromosome partitioning protein
MKTIAILSEKGGAGKTILSIHLAVAAEAHGLATAIFDLDARANSTIWGDHRPDRIPAVVPAQAPRLATLLTQARNNQADLVIFDTPGNAPDIAAQAAEHADAILIPCRPYGPDLLSIAATVKLAQASGKLTHVVINAAPVQGVETDEAIAAITASGVLVCPVILHARKSYATRFHEGLTAQEIEPKGKAAAEIDALLLWLCDKVIKLPSNKVTKVTEEVTA